MPEISRFLGIVIAILYRDHELPHFHATYGEYEITVGIRDGLVTGRFPRRALGHVLEWYAAHKPDALGELAGRAKPAAAEIDRAAGVTGDKAWFASSRLDTFVTM